MSPIYTSHQKHNSEVLRDILRLYAKPGNRILDLTYGEGKFWKGIETSLYDLVSNDLLKDNPSGLHFDFRRIDLPDESFDLVVLDPPYTHGVGSGTMHRDISHRYGLKTNTKKRLLRTNFGYIPVPLSADAITKMYKQGAVEAWRLLKRQGVLIVKTQDEIESGKQVWRHFDLKCLPGFRLIDLFVVTQVGKPLVRHKHQLHARKNHSFFMVYRVEEEVVKWVSLSTGEIASAKKS